MSCCLPPHVRTVRAYATCTQGGRKYMEDNYCVAYQMASGPSPQLSFIYLAIFDGHGGDMAANYAKQCLCHNIIRERDFWSDDDKDVLNAIKKGFLKTHEDMMREVVNWPKTASGLPSTSGTTASIVFIKNGKYYTGHVGDSRIVLGRQNPITGKWIPHALTKDHKPESPREKKRIEAAGGQVMNKSGVDRVVWNRPKSGHKGPIRRSTSFDAIPFLAVARSLGDLWSFNSELNTFIVSPEPDVKCIPVDRNDKCLLLASDGLWNMMATQTSIKLLQEVEEGRYSPELVEALLGHSNEHLSPSRALVHFCLNRWYQSKFRADNTTVIAFLIDQEMVECPLQSLVSNAQYIDEDLDDDESDDGYDEDYDAFEFFGDIDGRNVSKNGYSFGNNAHNNVNNDKLSEETECKSKLPENGRTDPTLPSDKSTETDDRLTSEANSESSDAKERQQNAQTVDESNGEQKCDSGMASPVLSMCQNSDQLTDDEFAALPELVNLSQDNWEFFVHIDPRNLPLKATDVWNSELNDNIDSNKLALNCNNSYRNISYASEMLTPLTENSSYWTDSAFVNYNFKGRTSLPMNGEDSNGFFSFESEMFSSYSALKSFSNNFNSGDHNNRYAPHLMESNNNSNFGDNQLGNKSVNKSIKTAKRRRVSSLMTLKGSNAVNTVEKCMRSGKRKWINVSPNSSPPSKHLRSSVWSRSLISKQQLMQLSFTRKLKQSAVGRLTRSRLRPLKILRTYK